MGGSNNNKIRLIIDQISPTSATPTPSATWGILGGFSWATCFLAPRRKDALEPLRFLLFFFFFGILACRGYLSLHVGFASRNGITTYTYTYT